MRRTRCAWAGVVCAAVVAAGCLDKASRPDAPVRARSFGPTSPPAEGVYIDHVLIEQPVGDPFLNRELWSVGPAAAPPSVTALLAENGLRASVIGGNLPPKFQALVGSEPDTVNARRFVFGSAKEHVVPTAGPTDPCTFDLLTDLAGKRTQVTLRQARSGVMVRPEATADRRIKVWCEPQIQHGERQEYLRPTADATQFVMQGEVPTERYTGLGFEAALGPNEYLVIGWSADESANLGSAMFGVEAAGRKRQRVLVIRAGQLGGGPTDLPAIPTAHRRPSVAAEASKR
ncbi:MAG TPA: hypothetical protein VMZ71_02945 [Gemmataceae bacterium]|nr:hypothetical protein [Gemmataceae bacterium]